MAGVAATGGSTNAVLHMLAIASEFGIAFDVDDFHEIAERTPTIGDLRPGGRYSAADIYDAGGVGIVIRELLKQDLMARRLARPSPASRWPTSPPPSQETPGQDVFRPIEDPIKATGGLAILHGTLAPEGCVIKLAGHERRQFSGPARVFDSENECFAAVKDQQHRGRATSSCCATRGRSAVPACRRCSSSPRPSWARAWVPTWPCSPTVASAAARAA